MKPLPLKYYFEEGLLSFFYFNDESINLIYGCWNVSNQVTFIFDESSCRKIYLDGMYYNLNDDLMKKYGIKVFDKKEVETRCKEFSEDFRKNFIEFHKIKKELENISEVS